MSRLLSLQHEIQDTNALLFKLEQALRSAPESRALASDIRSLEQRQSMLQAEFLVESERSSREVCSYRLFNTDDEAISIRGFGSALSDFQEMVSLVFDAIKKGPKLRARLSPQIHAATRFDFGYSFSGSLGVVMTIENEKMLVGQTAIDDSVDAVFNLVKCQTPDDVASFAKVYGPPVIRSLYAWTGDHLDAYLGADIKWKSANGSEQQVVVGREHLMKLHAAIGSASDERMERVSLPGVLVGADVAKNKFRFAPDAGGFIAGSSAGLINADRQVTVPSRVRLGIEKKIVTKFATEREEITWTLVSIESAD